MSIQYAKFIQGTVANEDIISDGVPQIAFIGRSNVGKSSTLNALAGRKKLVKVGKTPGKTKEINFFDIQFEVGDHVYFVDLPGYGYAKVSKTDRNELASRIKSYLTHSTASISLVVLILDAKASLTAFDEQIIGYLKEYKRPFLIAANKIDKLNQKERSKLQRDLLEKVGKEAQIIMFSASTQKHVNLLELAIKNQLGFLPLQENIT